MLCEEWTPDKTLKQQVDDTDEMVFVHDSVRLVYVSESCAGLLGYQRNEMEGRLLINFLSASALVGMIQAISHNRLAKLMGRQNDFDPKPTKVKLKNGGKICLQACCSLDIDAEHADGKKVRLTVVEQVE